MRLFLTAFLFLYSSTGLAQFSCREAFSLQETDSRASVSSAGLASSQTSSLRSSRSATETTVYRDSELLRMLIKNRRYLSMSQVNGEGNKNSWFLSQSDNGRLYRVVVNTDRSGKVLDMYADKPTARTEKWYYQAMGRSLNMSPLRGTINLPRKGKRELWVDPSVLVKLDVKHNLSEESLVQALRRVPPNVKYFDVQVSSAGKKDSFLFFMDVGLQHPLKVIMVYEKNTYFLVTAHLDDIHQVRFRMVNRDF